MHKSKSGLGNMRFTTPAAKDKIAQIKLILSVCPMHKHDIAELIPADIRTTRIYLNYLHRAKRIHIARWERDIEGRERTYPTPVFAWGKGEDAEKPARFTVKEIKQRVWQKIKNDPDAHEALRKKRVINTMLANPKRVMATAWIFGAGL